MAAHFSLLIIATIFLKGVTTQITGIRLAGVTGGNGRTGRVEVLSAVGWGTVCEDTWDNNDARVVCAALGFGGGTALTGNPFGTTSLPIRLYQVLCAGTEPNLNACPVITQGTCNNGAAAGIQCDAPGTVTPSTGTCLTPATNVRLANNKTGVPDGIGVLEVQDPVSRTWGAVCNERFDVNAARVICRMLCYDETVARPLILPRTTFQTRLNVMVTNVSCTGREADFFRDCQHNPWGTGICAPSEAVAVTCLDYNPCYPYDCYKAPPTPLVNCNDTYMEVKFSLLDQPTLTVDRINPIPANCTVSKYISTSASGQRFVTVLFQTMSCVNLTFNATHFLYHARLLQSQSNTSSSVITRDRVYVVDAFCALPRQYNVTKPFELVTESVTALGLGRFFVRMRFWYTDFFRRFYTTLVRLPVGDCLNVTVELITTNPRLKIGVPDCWVTPNPISIPYMYRDLFLNRQLIENTTIMYPLDALRIGFQYRVFQFIGYQQVMVHCKAVVCEQNDRSADCLRNYYSSRKRRSANSRIIQVESEPVYIISNNNNGPTAFVPNIVQNTRTPSIPETSTTRPTTSTATTTTTTTATTTTKERATTTTKANSTSRRTTSQTPTTTTIKPATSTTPSIKHTGVSTSSDATTATSTRPTSTEAKTTSQTVPEDQAEVKDADNPKQPSRSATGTTSNMTTTTASTTTTSVTTTTTGSTTTTSGTTSTTGSTTATSGTTTTTGNTTTTSDTTTTIGSTMTTSGTTTTTASTRTASSTTITTTGKTTTPRPSITRKSPLPSTVKAISSTDFVAVQALDMSLALNAWRDASLMLPLMPDTPILPGNTANVSVDMEDSDSRFYILVPSCWVAPVGNEKLYVELIRNRVITEETLTILKHDNNSLAFQFKTPRFNGYHSICIQCEVFVCNDKQCLTRYHIRSQHIPTDAIPDPEEPNQLEPLPYKFNIADMKGMKISSTGTSLLAQQGIVVTVLAVTVLAQHLLPF